MLRVSGRFYTPEFRFKPGVKNRLIDLYLHIFGAPYLTKRVEYWEAFPQIAPRKTDRVLDVGIGDCLVALNISPHVAEYHGVDVSVADLSRATRKIHLHNRAKPREPMNNIYLTACDAQDGLPYPSEMFDTVVSFSVLEHVPNDVRVFREMTRVVKKGGKIVVVVPSSWEDQKRLRLMFLVVNWPTWLKTLIGGSPEITRSSSSSEVCAALLTKFSHARIGYSADDFRERLMSGDVELVHVGKTVGFFGQVATDIANTFAAFGLRKAPDGLGYEARHDWLYAIWFACFLPFLWLDRHLTFKGTIGGWVLTLRRRAE